ncbi:Mur ligase family protein [Coraliomargarita akajimensis]|uniref:UDP-N-acetylmuramoylalanine--D-glutamate ligase n=1 Tax=Coraliomargarita akajimensis (strain DSM 45221 / IAM 15411 / JCM 23193 / KCTC 12865 / 04OKA010-24) TaxID=583355 RepID=D5EI42_CORAD|nr:Mur ligase family protein [Coraliomargarita akajimensis]ADE56082.1 UDP-N-acetylmuramoylalanine/D-glutamate ligase [Coraliomargarita akajimensis DSM 45221]
MPTVASSFLGKSRRIAVFGAGVSGRAAVKLCKQLGSEVCLYDEGGQGDCDRFTSSDLEGFDYFVFSPGFAAQHPWRLLAESSDRPCFSELGFAAWIWNGPLIGVTGTNGKTTVTTLLADGLENAGFRAVPAGNIGRPLSEVWLEFGENPDVWAVCEISSFQAELPLGIELDYLIWTNFAEDHLDRYESMDAYFEAKKQLLNCLSPGAPVLMGKSVKLEGALDAEHLPWYQSLEEGSTFTAMPQRKNFNLAAELWNQLGLPMEPLIEAANQFDLPPHRMHLVAEWGGVKFVNDSKATNFHAALAAIRGAQGPVFWIGGGSSKGGDLQSFAEQVAATVDHCFLYGEVAPSLSDCLKPLDTTVEIHEEFSAAVRGAAEAARTAGQGTVLLSPGFASFDQFESYAERGESFISAVLCLKPQQSAD